MRATQGEGQALSATVFGTVVHYAMLVLERAHHEGRADALEVAKQTFLHYWEPANMVSLDGVPRHGIEVWLPRQTYGGYRDRGLRGLELYYQNLLNDTGTLLALEQRFLVGITVDGEDHELTGTLDRLALRWGSDRKPYLSIDDFKTGRKPEYLRFATQWTVYGYATTQPLFWADFDSPEFNELHHNLVAKKGLDLAENPDGVPLMKRKGRWIAFDSDGKTHGADPKTRSWSESSSARGFHIHNAGWRDEADYRRLRVHLREYIKAVRADVWPLTVAGNVCTYCEFARNGMCGGEPLPELTEREKS